MSGPFDYITPDGKYRHELGNLWDERPPLVVCGINPSTATKNDHDNTSRRVERFARDSEAGGWVLVNPFAARTKDVRLLVGMADPIGPENDAYLRKWAACGTLVIAWGPPTKVPSVLRPRFAAVLDLFRGMGAPLHVLRFTKGGYPEHPLMLPAACRPILWDGVVRAR